MNKFCNSCGMPLSGENNKDFRGDFCNYCTDENGKLQPRELVQKGIAEWLKLINPQATEAEFLTRAGYYMKAMPAWANT